MRGKLNKTNRSEQGFTLIEIIVVVAILGILAAVLLPTVTGLLAMVRGSEVAREI